MNRLRASGGDHPPRKKRPLLVSLTLRRFRLNVKRVGPSCRKISIGSLSSDVFERRTSTGSGRFALLSHDFEQIFGQIVSIRIKTLGNKNTVASRLIKREKGLLPVDVRCSKTSLLKLPIIDIPFPRRGKGHVTGKWLFMIGYMIGKLKRKQTLRTEIGQLHSIFLFLWAKIGKKAFPSP